MNTTHSLSSRILTGLDVFVALAAITGGVSLLAGSGGPGPFPPEIMARNPFGSLVVPGLVLTFVVGGTALWAALASRVRWLWAPAVSGLAGVTLVGWICIQVLMLGLVSWLQPLLLGVGLAQVVLAGWVWSRRPALQLPVADAARAFLGTRRLAFVGLSTEPRDFSRMVDAALIAAGHEVVPIHPRAQEIGGRACWRRLSEVPDPPDVALLMVPPAAALGVVEDAIVAGVRALWFHRGAGAAGSGSPEAVARARAAGIEVIDGVCPMMYLGDPGFFHGAHRLMREEELADRAADRAA